MNERTHNILPISEINKKKKDIKTYPINFENIMNNSMSANDMRWSNSEKTPLTKMYTEWTKNN